MIKLAIASDHAGYELKELIKDRYKDKVEFIDLGPESTDSVDYPDYGYALAEEIEKGSAEKGIVVCGSGIGISIAANRYASVRAALCTTPEMASLSREHNNANVLALGARIIDQDTAYACVEAFLSTEYEEGGRHQQRVDKLKRVN